ncbi:hypothetical protein RDE2_19890 [Rhodococcus sp. RDE2]|nr:hypothetical protein RDE2_19890 [Rhodococcus sp. RDE2]
MTAGAYHFHGVGIEGHEHGGHTACPRGLDGTRYELLMAAVYTVEHADREYTPTPVRRNFVQTSPSLHIGSLRLMSGWGTPGWLPACPT